MDAYDQYLDSLTRKDRARQCIEDSKDRMRTIGSPLDQVIFKPPDDIDYEATWRSTSPSEEGCDYVTNVASRTKASKSCYKTSYDIIRKADDSRLTYCEGLAIPKHPGRASTHAWLEFDGEVIEMTWPWNGPQPHESAVYYGDSIPRSTVIQTHDRRPTFSSVLLPDEAYYQYDDVQRALADHFF